MSAEESLAALRREVGAAGAVVRSELSFGEGRTRLVVRPRGGGPRLEMTVLRVPHTGRYEEYHSLSFGGRASEDVSYTPASVGYAIRHSRLPLGECASSGEYAAALALASDPRVSGSGLRSALRAAHAGAGSADRRVLSDLGECLARLVPDTTRDVDTRALRRLVPVLSEVASGVPVEWVLRRLAGLEGVER